MLDPSLGFGDTVVIGHVTSQINKLILKYLFLKSVKENKAEETRVTFALRTFWELFEEMTSM